MAGGYRTNILPGPCSLEVNISRDDFKNNRKAWFHAWLAAPAVLPTAIALVLLALLVGSPLMLAFTCTALFFSIATMLFAPAVSGESFAEGFFHSFQ